MSVFGNAAAARAKSLANREKNSGAYLDQIRTRVAGEVQDAISNGKTSVRIRQRGFDSCSDEAWRREFLEVVARELRASGFAVKVSRLHFSFSDPVFELQMNVSWQKPQPRGEFPRVVRE